MIAPLLHSFRIEPYILLFNGVLFLVIVQIMDKLFWKPVLLHLERRKESIADAYRTVEETRTEMEQLRSEYQARLAQIEAEARGRIQQTVHEVQRQREEIIATARAESDRIMRHGEASIDQERQKALAGFRDPLNEAAAVALHKSLGISADTPQKRLIDEYVAGHFLQSE